MLKNTAFAGLKGLVFRNVLIVLQLSIAITLVIASFLIHAQMRFASNLEPGFKPQQILILRTDDNGSLARIQLLKDELLRSHGVSGATVSESMPERIRRYTFIRTEQNQTERCFAYTPVDFEYFAVFEIKLLAKRSPREDMRSDLIRTDEGDTASIAGSFIINERGARELGWSPEEAIGKLISRNGNWFSVVGVTTNTIESALAEITPAIYAVPEGVAPGRYLSLKLDATNPRETLSLIDATWKTVNPEEPIVYNFLDNSFQQLYQTENHHMYLLFLFSAITIALSCMGWYE